MDKTFFFSPRKAAVVVLVLLIVTQQVCASPVVSQDQSLDHEPLLQQSVRTLKRRARMTPLWRILNSKPFGAYCQNNYECSTGLCRWILCNYAPLCDRFCDQLKPTSQERAFMERAIKIQEMFSDGTHMNSSKL